MDEISRQLHTAISLDDRGHAFSLDAMLSYLRCVSMISDHFTTQLLIMQRQHTVEHGNKDYKQEIRLFHFARECLLRCEKIFENIEIWRCIGPSEHDQRHSTVYPTAPTLPPQPQPPSIDLKYEYPSAGTMAHASHFPLPSPSPAHRRFSYQPQYTLPPTSVSYPPHHSTLSFDALRSALSVSGRDGDELSCLVKQFNLLDQTRDSRIDMHEFSLGCFIMEQQSQSGEGGDEDDDRSGSGDSQLIKIGELGFNSALFRAFDINGSGFIEMSDFEHAIAVLLKGTPDERSALAMRIFDWNKKGYITMHDFTHILSQVADCLDQMGLGIVQKNYTTMQFEQLFRQCYDVTHAYTGASRMDNSSGYLMLSDMLVLLKENPLLLRSLGQFDTSTLRARKLRTVGTPITPGHTSWPRVLSMMLGIRYCQLQAQGQDAAAEYKIRKHDFSVKFSIQLPAVVPSIGSPYHQTTNALDTVAFHDRAPIVFRKIRHLFGISEEEYALSFSPEQLLGGLLQGELTTMSEKLTDGKSGNFFYSTHNGLFLCKTISHDELGTFCNILPRYLRHIQKYPDSLLCRFYGLHQIDKDTPFVVMGNAFETTRTVDEVFDLKGSTYKRTNPDPKGVRKDLDWTSSGRRIKIGAQRRQQLLDQIQADCKFLQSNEIIDYSLLVGISKVHPREHIELTKAPMVSETRQIPFHKIFDGGILAEDGSEVYFVSIIDTLIHYGLKKFAEHWIKAVWTGDGQAISVTEPGAYATRFMGFMNRVIQ